ncbi:hypothetical protein [Halosolutus halophilus]|uniref:hypothetical protein n=1 Tax=Halosolutus halophilus TaxID=1552990 RepID=UPI0022350379|nr:hypothetical protein [Halosolutus halophilus]
MFRQLRLGHVVQFVPDLDADGIFTVGRGVHDDERPPTRNPAPRDGRDVSGGRVDGIDQQSIDVAGQSCAPTLTRATRPTWRAVSGAIRETAADPELADAHTQLPDEYDQIVDG